MLPFISKAKSRRYIVLDLACGPAAHLITAARSCSDVTFIGVDLSKEMLAEAQKSKNKYNLSNLSFCQADIREISQLDISPSFVMSTMALHHLPTLSDLSSVFEQIAKVLPAFGKFFIIDFIKPKTKKTIDLMVEQSRKTGAGEAHLKDYRDSLCASFSQQEMKNAIQKTGSFHINYSPSWPLRALQIIEGQRLPDAFIEQKNSLTKDQLEILDSIKMSFKLSKLRPPNWL